MSLEVVSYWTMDVKRRKIYNDHCQAATIPLSCHTFHYKLSKQTSITGLLGAVLATNDLSKARDNWGQLYCMRGLQQRLRSTHTETSA